jgi:RNA polymerase sigma-70 factor (ECF subfamily)
MRDSTCWTVIEGAAAGNGKDRDEFARRYAPVVRAYLVARWQASTLRQEVEDAVQEVFVECFRQGGVLERADRGQPGGFRAFIHGVIRNVALRVETRKAREREVVPSSGFNFDAVGSSEGDLSKVFDRAWAKAVFREAAQLQRERAEEGGKPEAKRRVELLHLRFQEGLPVREVARLWGVDPAAVHREYARARKEFKEALKEVVAFHHPGTPEDVNRECADLLRMLG